MTTPREIVERLREIAGQQKLYSDLVLKSGNEFHAETLSAYAKLDYEAASTIERLVEALELNARVFNAIEVAVIDNDDAGIMAMAKNATARIRALTGGE